MRLERNQCLRQNQTMGRAFVLTQSRFVPRLQPLWLVSCLWIGDKNLGGSENEGTPTPTPRLELCYCAQKPQNVFLHLQRHHFQRSSIRQLKKTATLCTVTLLSKSQEQRNLFCCRKTISPGNIPKHGMLSKTIKVSRFSALGWKLMVVLSQGFDFQNMLKDFCANCRSACLVTSECVCFAISCQPSKNVA